MASRFGVTLGTIRYHAKKAGVWGGIRKKPLEERFWPKVAKSSECWEWTGSIFQNGYGCFRIDGQSVGAHRISYELSNGPIPTDLVIDHLCRNRKCVNPAHLEAVSMPENVRRGMALKGRKYTLKGVDD